MTSRRFIRLRASQRDSSIYRIIPADRLLELLETRSGVLVRPAKWEDPWESLFDATRAVRSGSTALNPSHPILYSQCWTRQYYSDAMWRAYSPTRDGVRIRSTPRRLLESVPTTRDVDAAVIGRVRYVSERLLLATASGSRPSDAFRSCYAALMKRRCFAFESEVRLIVIARGNQKLYRYTLDPAQLIDQIMLHPLMTTARARALRAAIVARGFLGAVKRSLLYSAPQLT